MATDREQPQRKFVIGMSNEKYEKNEGLSAIYLNAVDSLRIGMEFFLKESDYSSRKHAVLTVFHAIELLLKEQLSQTNSILIYKNIDAKITEESLTVGNSRSAHTAGESWS